MRGGRGEGWEGVLRVVKGQKGVGEVDYWAGEGLYASEVRKVVASEW